MDTAWPVYNATRVANVLWYFSVHVFVQSIATHTMVYSLTRRPDEILSNNLLSPACLWICKSVKRLATTILGSLVVTL